MYANGFLEEKRRSPASLAAVIGLHGAALAAVMIYGTYTFVKQDPHRTTVINVTDPQIPPPEPPPPPQPREAQVPQEASHMTVVPPIAPLNQGPVAPPAPPTPPQPPAPPGPQLALNTTPALPPPVRRAAQVDPNYRDALQPPYPRDMETAGRNGSVRVRITIGTDGRVSAIEQLTATDPSFWRVTERQARNRWRFRPATVDGRPVVSTMVMTVTFRIPDEA